MPETEVILAYVLSCFSLSRPFMRTIPHALFCTALLLGPSVLLAQTPVAAAPPAAPAVRTCRVLRSDPPPGESQLSAEDFTGAESTFRQALTRDSTSAEAHLGLVRALLGEDRLADARTEAEGMLKANPRSAVAEVALAEVDYRAGDPDTSLVHARKALSDDPCEARAEGAIASILVLHGYYAREATLLDQAHRLRPDDELLRRFWISSLSRKRQEEEIARYLDGQHHLSEDDARGYGNNLSYLKAHHPGDCRVTSKSETAQLAFQPIYGDNAHPVAFGLDVTFNNTRRRMQIDTGASGIILTPGAARALKLQPEYKVKAGGVGDEGEVDSYLAHVEKIRIGDIELTNCMVEVMAKSRLHVDGLIGPDVFSRWLVTLDYGAAKAKLEPLPPRPGDSPKSTSGDAAEGDATASDTGPKDRYIAPEMKDWGRVLRIGHNILLPSYFKADSPTHYLIMDTGASESVLSNAMARETGKLHDSATQFYGISGKVNKVFETNQTPLTVANLMLAPSEYYAYDITGISHNMGFETSGFLGLPTLQRLTIHIDYRDNLVKIDYDPKHDIQRF